MAYAMPLERTAKGMPPAKSAFFNGIHRDQKPLARFVR
jgi:hypothetical protein